LVEFEKKKDIILADIEDGQQQKIKNQSAKIKMTN